MAARGHHIFTRDERALVHRFINAGEFRDVAEFEEFAIRRALAQLRLQELYDLRKATGVRPISLERILRETRKVRRQMWKERFPRDTGKKRKYARVPRRIVPARPLHRIPPDLLEMIDRRVAESEFRDREEFIAQAVRRMAASLVFEDIQRRVGTDAPMTRKDEQQFVRLVRRVRG